MTAIELAEKLFGHKFSGWQEDLFYHMYDAVKNNKVVTHMPPRGSKFDCQFIEALAIVIANLEIRHGRKNNKN